MDDKWVVPRDRWVEISLNVPEALASELDDYLWSVGIICGATSNKEGGSALLVGHLAGSLESREEEIAGINSFLEALSIKNQDVSIDPASFREISSLDRERWRDTFKTTKISDRLVVKPVWDSAPDTEAVLVEIDPGMAFGTGMHETTSMCLRLIDEMVEEGTSMLDVGTGTGILAIAASKLGAARVLAIDIDERAQAIAVENIAANGVSSQITLSHDSIAMIDEQFDGIAANILSIDLIAMAEDIGRNLKPGGWAILSGIRRKYLKELAESYKKYGMELDKVAGEGEWLTPVFRKDS